MDYQRSKSSLHLNNIIDIRGIARCALCMLDAILEGSCLSCTLVHGIHLGGDDEGAITVTEVDVIHQSGKSLVFLSILLRDVKEIHLYGIVRAHATEDDTGERCRCQPLSRH